MPIGSSRLAWYDSSSFGGLFDPRTSIPPKSLCKKNLSLLKYFDINLNEIIAPPKRRLPVVIRRMHRQ